MDSKIRKLNTRKQKIAGILPPLTELVRGTFIEWYQVCARKNCKCHKSKKDRHGPYYRISFTKGNRTYHIYVPLKNIDKARRWVENYNKVWQGIEDISAINTELIHL